MTGFELSKTNGECLVKKITIKKLIKYQAIYLLFISILISSFLIAIKRLGRLQNLELLTYNWLINANVREWQEPRILVVEITDRDIEEQQQWPICDATIAIILEKLQEYKPQVIGLDLYRDIVYPPGTQKLNSQLQAQNLIAVSYLGDEHNRIQPPGILPPERVGFNDMVLDVDNVLRRNLMYARIGDRELSSFALRLSLAYLQKDTVKFRVDRDFLQINDVTFKALTANFGGYQMPTSEAVGWQILIDYRHFAVVDRISLSEVLAGKLTANRVKDKIVIIGTTAPSIKDLFYTPYTGERQIMPGAIAHAQMVSQILRIATDDSTLLWSLPEWTENFWIWLWSILGASLVWRWKHPLSIASFAIIGIGGLWSIGYFSFSLGGWIPFVPSLLAFTLTGAGVLGYKVIDAVLYDTLTGLPNRSLFARQLQKLATQQPKTEKAIAILCLDLDRFKLINDALGYQAGDRLLTSIARRLEEELTSEELLARIGPDEFAIAYITDKDRTQLLENIARLEAALALPLKLNPSATSYYPKFLRTLLTRSTSERKTELLTFPTVSIGLAFSDLTTDFAPDELLREAHTAMYRAKTSGKAQHQVFAPKMHELALKRLELEAELHQAIELQEFELYYQPIICLKTGSLAGFESLVRWQSPRRGFVAPDAFIPVAEETGLILPMGEWILTEACRQMVAWQQQFDWCKSLSMSVNLSTRQFSQPNLVSRIQQILTMTGLNSQNLKLEITESMVMDDVENTIILLGKLKSLGIKLSMDDFGTGFSSFSYLHRFSMDTLKVDRSFVSNMSKGSKNQEIVSTIVMLAHQLGMDLVAEGIETETEKNILQSLNCEYGQGYLFAKPLNVEGATEFLLAHH
jgi:diguanylate cyclase (GGDEF)-like protein